MALFRCGSTIIGAPAGAARGFGPWRRALARHEAGVDPATYLDTGRPADVGAAADVAGVANMGGVVDVATLVRRAAEGDKWAWERLVDQFGRLIWSITRDFRLPESDASDVFQATWLRLLEHIDRLEYPARVGSWIATTARHECLRCVAGRKKVLLAQEDLLPARDATQALVPRGCRDPRADASRILEPIDMFKQAQPGCLEHVRGITLRQPEVSGNRPDKPAELINKPFPRPLVAFGGAPHKRRDIHDATHIGDASH